MSAPTTRMIANMGVIWSQCEGCGKDLDLRNVYGLCHECKRKPKENSQRNRRCEPGCTCGHHNGSLRGRIVTNNPHIITRHDRIRSERGRADEYECYGCDERAARDWAQLYGSDELDPDSYIPLCRGCHIVYDRTGEGILERELRNPEWRQAMISKVMREMRERG